MAGRGTFVSIALAFALVLLSVSVCRCVTFTYSSKTGVMTDKERNDVYVALKGMAQNAKREILVDKEYNSGRLFTKYINLEKKDVVIRLTRWSRDCSISSDDTSEGRDLLAAWTQLVPLIHPYVLKGHEWVALSDNLDWIEYYVIKDAPPPGTPPPRVGEDSYNIFSYPSNQTDCTIQPYMMLSHHSALPFSQLRPGEDLTSPDGKYKLTIPQPGRVMAPCVLYLVYEINGTRLWQTNLNPPLTQNNCYLAFRSDGTLELWNSNQRIWNTQSACPFQTNCDGSASLALTDGHVKLYQSDHGDPSLHTDPNGYWTIN